VIVILNEKFTFQDVKKRVHHKNVLMISHLLMVLNVLSQSIIFLKIVETIFIRFMFA